MSGWALVFYLLVVFVAGYIPGYAVGSREGKAEGFRKGHAAASRYHNKGGLK